MEDENQIFDEIPAILQQKKIHRLKMNKSRSETDIEHTKLQL